MIRQRRNVPLVRPSWALREPPTLRGALRDVQQWRRWCRYWLLDPAVGLAEHAFCRFFRALPVDTASALGARLGRYRRAEQSLLTERARLALHHMDPALPATGQDIILAKLRASAGRAFVEALIADRICREHRVSLGDPGRFAAVLDCGRPLIFVSVHTANLGDLLGTAVLQVTGHRGASTTRLVENRFRQRLIVKLRSTMNVAMLHPQISAARQLLRHLAHPRHSVLLHLDEARGRQIHFPSFGRPLPRGSNLSLALRLARMTGALIVPLHLTRAEGVRFTLHVAEPIDLARMGDTETPAAQLDRHFETVIRHHIDEWLQLYYLRI